MLTNFAPLAGLAIRRRARGTLALWGTPGLLAALLLAFPACDKPANQPSSQSGGVAPRAVLRARPAKTGPRASRPASPRRARPAPGQADPVLWLTADDAKRACDQHLARAAALQKKLTSTHLARTARTRANTLEPMNRLLIELDRVLPMSDLVANVAPDKAVRKAAEACQRRAKKFESQLKLDRGVYDALVAVKPDGLAPNAKRFRRLLLRDYKRAGVDRDAATRKQLAALDALRVKLGQQFARNIREDKRSLEVTVADLAGMPADFVKAHSRKKTPAGKIRITTDYPDFFPVESYAKSDAVRRDLYRAFGQRAYPANQKVLLALLKARYQYATLLGYPSWAAYAAEDKMVKKKEVIARFIDKVAGLARPRMKADLAAILARKRKDLPGAARVEQWDRFYYVKKLRAERFGVKPAEVRAYFAFRAVKKGLLRMAQDLFGLRFQRALGAPVWHPKVEAYDVFDGPTRIGRFYLDLHPRKGKYGHAAEFPMNTGVPGVQLPAAALVTNFPDPATSGGGPALMEHHQVTTFFHEFGHLMHQILAGRHHFVTQSGIACEWDFVEAPSQLLEEWSWDPGVLSRFARHYKTGKTIPPALLKKMRAAEAFGKGVYVMRQLYYAALSLAYHDRNPAGLNLLATAKAVGRRYSPYPYQKGTYVFANFGHLNGYSSMYYTYMWSLMLAKDMLTRFRHVGDGLMSHSTATAYRKAVLEPGGTRDAADLVKTFLGRPYSFAAFQAWLKE